MKKITSKTSGLASFAVFCMWTLSSFAGNVIFTAIPEGSTISILDEAGKLTTETIELNKTYPDTGIVLLNERGRIIVQPENSDTKSIIIGDVGASFTLEGTTPETGIAVNPSENSSTLIILGSFKDDEDAATLYAVVQEQHVLGPRRDAEVIMDTPTEQQDEAPEVQEVEAESEVVVTATTYTPSTL